MVLLDTNVISELRKASSGRANAQVVAWAAQQAVSELFISAITLWELEVGVQRMERRDAQQGALLRQWLEGQLLPAFRDRILPFDEAAARACAAWHVPDPRSERDSMIAATAAVRGFAVATRNLADFEGLVQVIDPWSIH